MVSVIWILYTTLYIQRDMAGYASCRLQKGLEDYRGVSRNTEGAEGSRGLHKGLANQPTEGSSKPDHRSVLHVSQQTNLTWAGSSSSWLRAISDISYPSGTISPNRILHMHQVQGNRSLVVYDSPPPSLPLTPILPLCFSLCVWLWEGVLSLFWWPGIILIDKIPSEPDHEDYQWEAPQETPAKSKPVGILWTNKWESSLNTSYPYHFISVKQGILLK